MGSPDTLYQREYLATQAPIDAHGKLFSGLRDLGLRERGVRAVLAKLLVEGESKLP